jgi:hypothetical protein
MINVLIIGIGIGFFLFSVAFAVWSARSTRKADTREHYYNDFMKRKSEREKLRLP